MKKLFPLFIFFYLPSLTLCMDVVKDDIFISQIFPKHIQDNPGTCSHDTICALALVNKKWNEFIQNTTVQRRRYLAFTPDYRNLHTAHKEIYQQQVWHKNNTAYAYWVKMEDKETRFYLNYFDDNDKISTSEYNDTSLKNATFQDFRPFFNSQGNACCHAWHAGGLIELSLSTKNLLKKRFCYLDLGNDHTKHLKHRPYFVWIKFNELPESFSSNHTCPTIIKNYPVLLKAFINSQHVKETDNQKIYHLDGVTIDESYVLKGAFPTQWWRNIVAQNGIIKKKP